MPSSVIRRTASCNASVRGRKGMRSSRRSLRQTCKRARTCSRISSALHRTMSVNTLPHTSSPSRLRPLQICCTSLPTSPGTRTDCLMNDNTTPDARAARRCGADFHALNVVARQRRWFWILRLAQSDNPCYAGLPSGVFFSMKLLEGHEEKTLSSGFIASLRMTMALRCHGEPCFAKAKHPNPRACSLAVTGYKYDPVP